MDIYDFYHLFDSGRLLEANESIALLEGDDKLEATLLKAYFQLEASGDVEKVKLLINDILDSQPSESIFCLANITLSMVYYWQSDFNYTLELLTIAQNILDAPTKMDEKSRKTYQAVVSFL